MYAKHDSRMLRGNVGATTGKWWANMSASGLQLIGLTLQRTNKQNGTKTIS